LSIETISIETAANSKVCRSSAPRPATALALTCLIAAISIVPATWAQSSPSQPGTQTQSATPPAQAPAQDADIPDAPTVQPSTAPPEPSPIPKPEEKKPATVQRDPWTNEPIKPNTPPPNSNQFPESDNSTGDAAPPPPSMPPVRTLPPGSTKPPASQEQLYTLVVRPTFVQVPVTVKDHDGRMVDGLLPTDFSVKENGTIQKLSYFSSDPFALSVAVVLDLGMSDAAVQKVSQTFPALMSAFAPYDEVALYTYSSTVSEVSDFSAANQHLAAILNQMKTERGRNNGVPVMSGPLAPNGPIVNGIPVGSPTEPVYTPTKEAHVLNDAILQAALDLGKRARTRRKIIFVISDGRESGSKASYKDVLRVLLSREIQVKAVALESGALPVYRKIERLHIPDQAYGDLLPKYTSATGGGTPFTELTRNAIEDSYADAMSEARNQYTLGYTPAPPKTPTAKVYRSIEVLVDHPGLKVIAKDGYYPAAASR
jgi:VWFA-related protein